MSVTRVLERRFLKNKVIIEVFGDLLDMAALAEIEEFLPLLDSALGRACRIHMNGEIIVLLSGTKWTLESTVYFDKKRCTLMQAIMEDGCC